MDAFLGGEYCFWPTLLFLYG